MFCPGCLFDQLRGGSSKLYQTPNQLKVFDYACQCRSKRDTHNRGHLPRASVHEEYEIGAEVDVVLFHSTPDVSVNWFGIQAEERVKCVRRAVEPKRLWIIVDAERFVAALTNNGTARIQDLCLTVRS